MQIGVVGVNHKLASLACRETIAKACQRRFLLDNPLSHGTFVLLSTCNRIELYFTAESLSSCHEEILNILKQELREEFEQKLYTFFGFDCFLHLAKVTAGLDSAIVAETEIQGQVKAAYESACNVRQLASSLHFLFQKCLKIGKQARSEYLITNHIPGLEHALYWYAKDHFGQDLPAPLFIGVSQINVKIARYLQKKGVREMHFCNRTDKKAKTASLVLDGHMLPWRELHDSWQNFRWVISATKSPSYILTQKSQNAHLLVDLAVPRNIDPAVESIDTKLLNIDDLQLLLAKRKALLQQNIQLADTHVQMAVKRQIARNKERNHPLRLAIGA